MGGVQELVRFLLLASILVLTIIWFAVTEDERERQYRRKKGIINRYRLEYIYGEIAKKLTCGRGKLRELTVDNVELFALKYGNTDIFWNALAYRDINEELYDSPRWGDAYFAFKVPIDDFYNETEIALATEVLKNAREFVNLLIEKHKFPEWAIKSFFTGDGFDILVSAVAMGVEPRGDLCQIYKEFRDYMEKEYNLEYMDEDIYGYRAMIRCPNTINSRVSERVPRYKIELSIEEFMSLSIREIDLLSRGPRELIVENDFYHRVHDIAHYFYLKMVEKYEKHLSTIDFLPLPQNGNTGNVDILRPCVKRILQEGIEEGDIKDAAKIIAEEYKRLKYPEDVTLNNLKKWLKTFSNGALFAFAEELTNAIYQEDSVEKPFNLCESEQSCLAQRCIGKKECEYFIETQLEKEREKFHDETLFELRGWPIELRPIKTAVYRGIVVFEEKNNISPGNSLVILLSELTAYVGLHTTRATMKCLRDLKIRGLLEEYVFIEGTGGRVRVKRKIPIPELY